MIDRKKLDLTRQWAADIDAARQTLSQDTIDAAAEVIRDLPTVIVDGDKLREWREKHEGSISDNALIELEALLPAPAPRTLADIAGPNSLPDPNGARNHHRRGHGGTVKQLFSHQELQAIAEVQTTVYRVNNPVGNPEPFEGYFTWSYIRYGDVVATQSGDFPDQVEIRGNTNE